MSKEQQWEELQDLARPHIDSYNYFLQDGLHKAVKLLLPVEFEMPQGERCSLFIHDVTISSPQLPETNRVAKSNKVYPSECRQRHCNYSGDVTVRCGWNVAGKLQSYFDKVVGEIPIMVRSQACHLHKLGPKELIRHGEEAQEMGGYFIIGGNEKIIRMLILPRRNFPLCTKRPSWKNNGEGFTEYGLTIRCVREDQSAIKMVLHYLDTGRVVLCIAYNKQLYFLPLILVLKCLLEVSDKYIHDQVLRGREGDTFFKETMMSMFHEMLEFRLLTRSQMLKHLGNLFRIKLTLPEWYTDEQVGEFVVSECICVHLETNQEKFHNLIYMTKKLLSFVNKECIEESTDNPMNQELLLSGHLILMLLKEKLQTWLYSLKMGLLKIIEKKNLQKLDLLTITTATRFASSITRPLDYLLSTGNLNSHSGLALMQNTGFSLAADRLNFFRFMSHFRSVHRGAFFATMRTTEVRKLRPETWGFLCPVHTPDGAPCGLLNHLTATCQVVNTVFPTKSLVDQLHRLGMFSPTAPLPIPLSQCYTVFMDGRMLGYLPDFLASNVANHLRTLKVQSLKEIPPVLEICLVPKTGLFSRYPGLYLFTSLARMIRPVTNLAYNKVEMIGSFEQVYMNIATCVDDIYPEATTHMEITEECIYSIVASLTPFSDHNPSPRNMYQCQMAKQTMGTPVHAFRYRADNKLYRLTTPQTPIARPRAHEQFHIDEYPAGTNAILAVISYTGYTMEDAIIINKASYERGFAHGCMYKSVVVDLPTMHKDQFGRQSMVFGCESSIEGLDADGLPLVGTRLTEGSPFYSYLNLLNNTYKIKRYTGSEEAYVEQVKILGSDTGQEPLNNVCIMLRITRNPEIGDKFSSRHGQKGILSFLWPQEDMPFTESGMIPDILFNPHGFPSRMTVGQLIETMAGKSGALHGHLHDATPFTFSEDQPAVDYFGDLLSAAGYSNFGTEVMYCGDSGTEMEVQIFMGVVYYQRLRHMVSDKFQVRTTGPVDPLTMQPVQGRHRMGGVRFGEMERDALLAHGTSFMLHDRLFRNSDRCLSHICKECGNLLSPILEKPPPSIRAASFEDKRKWKCLLCGRSDTIVLIAIPYSLKYLIVELGVMGIKVALKVK